MDPPSAGRRSHLIRRLLRHRLLPLWSFVAFVAAAGPLIIFHFGAHRWFLRDEWSFIADRGGSRFPDLIEPNGGAHWVAVPRIVFWGLWQIFGITTYRPYLVGVVILHLVTAVLLRVVMRRAGVGPWLATCAASVLVLYGPGSQNFMWAFQIGFIGSVAYGLVHLLLTDHDGPVGRNDAVGLLFGLLAIMSSGVGITMTVAVGVAVAIRRGWRPALMHTVPLGAIYLIWSWVADARSSPLGAPSPGVLISWIKSSAIGTLVGLGYFGAIAWGLLAVLLVGTILAWRGGVLGADRRRLAVPSGLLVATLFFMATTGLGRWWLGQEGARADRYVYLQSALVLPMLAVAAECLARRWRRLTPLVFALILVPVPLNLGGFDDAIFGKEYMANRRYVLTTAPRMPFARDVPRDVQPIPDIFSSDAVTIGFLLTAASNGDLNPSEVPLTPRVVNEFKVRLGVAQRHGRRTYPTGCEQSDRVTRLEPEVGDRLYIGGPVAIATTDGEGPTSPAVTFTTMGGGTELTIELPDLHLQIGPRPGATQYTLCKQG
ncbi:MAG: hypothetical protein ACOYXM_09185 [Actinomycetota bacterium]